MAVDMNKLVNLDRLKEFKTAENAATASEFSTSKSYAIGEYVYYKGKLYKFKSAHAAGAWTTADVEEAKLAEDVSDLKSAINNNYPIDTATGLLAAFEDGLAGGKALSANFTGQLYHTGKQLLNPQLFNNTTTIQGITFEKMPNGNTFHIYGQKASGDFVQYNIINNQPVNIPVGSRLYVRAEMDRGSDSTWFVQFANGAGYNAINDYNSGVSFILGNNTPAEFAQTIRIIIRIYTSEPIDFYLRPIITAKESWFATPYEAYKSEVITDVNNIVLYGGKEIFTDATGEISLSYQANTQAYIDKKIAELQATMLENIGG